jgi:predicted NBD/HSP70 family sugar kinase
MVINYDGEPCYCGKFGCVECYASILAIEKRYKSYIKLGRNSVITKNTKDITYIDIINVAEDGEILANEVLEFSARLLAIGLKNYITLVDTQKIVLSGPIINTSNIFYNYLLKSIKEDIQDYNIVLVKGGKYKDNAIALGAAQMFVKEKLLK